MKRIAAAAMTRVWMDPALPAVLQSSLRTACSEEGWDISATRARARILIAHLPRNQRHVPETVCSALRERRDHAMAVLCCEAPLREHHISLHGGLVHLMSCPQDVGEARALLAALAWHTQDESASASRSLVEEIHGAMRCAFIPGAGDDSYQIDRVNGIQLVIKLHMGEGDTLRCRLQEGRANLRLPRDWRFCFLGTCRIPDCVVMPHDLNDIALDHGDLLLALPESDPDLQQAALSGWPRLMDALAERLQRGGASALAVGVA